MMAVSYGVAPASTETYMEQTLLRPTPSEVLAHDLLDLLGEPQPVTPDRANTAIKVDKVRECFTAAPPPLHLTTQGWMENEKKKERNPLQEAI